MQSATEVALTRALRESWPQIIGSLVRILGDVQRAEDCAQDAAVQALRHWETRGVPDEPRAWLIRAARNGAVDLIRREGRRATLEHEAVRLHAATSADEPDDTTDELRGFGAPNSAGPGDTDPAALSDDVVRLFFLCCHPALAPDAQAALCLRLIAGLTTPEIARAFLVSEATMGKRLTRAKQKIAIATIPFVIPRAGELAGRLDGVASTIYLLFNEGYAASDGETILRPELTGEALRLGRLVHDLLPEQPTTSGLLALMMLHDARRATRVDDDGSIVLLRSQDRTLWDHAEIRAGVSMLGHGLANSPATPNAYVVQAAIAACHALAPTWDATDWPAIASWYDVLLTISDTPVVRLNAAAALAERDGPAAGLLAIDAIDGLGDYPLWHAARAELLDRLSRRPEALVALDTALASPASAALRHHLERRRSEIAAA